MAKTTVFFSQVWSYPLPTECQLLISHPKLPLLYAGSSDGRFFVFAIKIEYVPTPDVLSDEDDEEAVEAEDEGDKVDDKSALSEGELKIGRYRGETLVVSATLFAERGILKHPLDFGATDPSGNFLVAGNKELGNRIYLCDIQKPASSSLFQQRTKETDGDTKEYFQVVGCADLEGQLLDISFVQKTVICLSNAEPSSGEAGEDILSMFSGDQITIFKIDKVAKTINISNILTLREKCSGICLADNAKFFFTLTHRRKYLAKFKVLDQERVAKLCPVSKTETVHQMDLNMMMKSRDKSGTLALAGRDGFVSFVPMDADVKSTSQFVHFNHYETGGVKTLDVAKTSGSILALNDKGSLQIFQNKTTSPTVSTAAGQLDYTSPIVQPRSPMPTEEDPWIGELMMLPDVVPEQEPTKLCWADEQEQKTRAKERKKYENQINQVSEELEALRNRVQELLVENDKLPESERIDRHEFELDVEEQQKRIHEGWDKEEDLMLELQAWQVARRKVGKRIRKEVWDDMEVKGMSIKVFGFNGKFSIKSS